MKKMFSLLLGLLFVPGLCAAGADPYYFKPQAFGPELCIGFGQHARWVTIARDLGYSKEKIYGMVMKEASSTMQDDPIEDLAKILQTMQPVIEGVYNPDHRMRTPEELMWLFHNACVESLKKKRS